MSSRPRGSLAFLCPLCQYSHGVKNCPRFLSNSATERCTIVEHHGLCRNCLAQSHETENCSSKNYCRRCHRKHHTLLHETKASVAEAPQREKSVTSCVTLEMTAEVIVCYEDREKVLRAHINPELQRSLITMDAAKKLKLSLLYRASNPKIPICYLVLKSQIDSSIQLTCSFNVIKTSHERSPRREADTTCITNSHPDLLIADRNFYKPLTIDLVLGADIYPRIAKAATRKFHGVPIAQATVFGWTFHGDCPRAD